MNSAKQKGDLLEDAVAAIEELILQIPPWFGEKPSIEKKKIVRVDGVRHEIDICVTINPAAGYSSIFIFECKNWEKAVNKNEIIVFSEKIDATGAATGYFVAKSYTSDAEAQARKDARIVLLRAIEHDPATASVDIEMFSRVPQMTRLDVTFKVRGSQGLKITNISLHEARAQYQGKEQNLKRLLNLWSREIADSDLAAFNNRIVPEGTFKKSISGEREFACGELLIDQLEMEKVALGIDYEINVVKSAIESHLEVQSRGKFFRFAPLTLDTGVTQWQVAISDPALANRNSKKNH